MRNYRKILINCLLLILFAGILIAGCRRDFDEYYKEPSSSSVKMFDTIRKIPEYSKFVEYMEKFKLDSLFDRNQSYTLFIPLNSAFANDSVSETELLRIMQYNITNSVLLPSQIKDYKKIQTFAGKFSILERNEEELFRDGVLIYHGNPLYMDGTYYTLETLLRPRPNLFEFVSDTCPILASYINSLDSIAFDPITSVPIGFDTTGNTIYDSVFNMVNTFERDYFPVSEESRSNTATLLLCTQKQYTDALNIMASNLGTPFTDHNDIPVDWQQEVFIPYIFDNGTFIGSLDYDEFKYPLVQNILGDSIRVDYTKIDEESRFVGSNGITFLYNSFDVPVKLYIDTLILEAEDLAISNGTQYSWDENVLTNNNMYPPAVISSPEASNGQYLSVTLPRGHSTIYYVEFLFPKVFPNRYNFLWRANYRPSGNISIFFNDKKIGFFDNYYFRNPVDGIKPSTSGFNQKVWKNILVEEYGDLRIRFEYQTPGAGTSNGLNIDYVALFPVN